MPVERDFEVALRAVREARTTRSQDDTQTLMGSWRAIARSHRRLSFGFYKLGDGEFVVRRVTPTDSGLQGSKPK